MTTNEKHRWMLMLTHGAFTFVWTPGDNAGVKSARLVLGDHSIIIDGENRDEIVDNAYNAARELIWDKCNESI